jgi:hypothetical protein
MLPKNSTIEYKPLIVPRLPTAVDKHPFRPTLLAPLAATISSLLPIVEELDFKPGDLEEMVWTEAELAALGLSGFVDFETGSVVTQVINWHDFTARFMEFCEYSTCDRSYCQLAVAIAKADGKQKAWDYYLNLSRACSHHYHEMADNKTTDGCCFL